MLAQFVKHSIERDGKARIGVEGSITDHLLESRNSLGANLRHRTKMCKMACMLVCLIREDRLNATDGGAFGCGHGWSGWRDCVCEFRHDATPATVASDPSLAPIQHLNNHP